MKKINKKVKKSLLTLISLLSLGTTFGLGVGFSEPIKTQTSKLEEFSNKKEGIATYSSIGSALVLPTIIFGSYRILTRKRRKLKNLEIEKRRLEIKELENKLREGE